MTLLEERKKRAMLYLARRNPMSYTLGFYKSRLSIYETIGTGNFCFKRLIHTMTKDVHYII